MKLKGNYELSWWLQVLNFHFRAVVSLAACLMVFLRPFWKELDCKRDIYGGGEIVETIKRKIWEYKEQAHVLG